MNNRTDLPEIENEATDAVAPEGDAPDDAAAEEDVQVTAAPEAAGQRLDAFLAATVPGLSRSRVKALILEGHVSLNGETLGEPKRPVKSGETFVVEMPPIAPAEPQPEAIPLTIVHEDKHLLVIEKPAGLVVHPAAGHHSGTLVNALLHHCGSSLSGIGGIARPGIVHRLDKDTSGLMVVAKTDLAHAGLSEQFADHGRTGPLQRGYKALVWGAPEASHGTIDAAIGRSTKNRQLMAVSSSSGRQALTHYVVEEVFGQGKPVASLLDLRLETGRTHQIRVHLTALGHPVVGDPAYGLGFRTKALSLSGPAQAAVAALGRQALHAYLLGFVHPKTGREMVFNSPIPSDMLSIINSLRKM